MSVPCFWISSKMKVCLGMIGEQYNLIITSKSGTLVLNYLLNCDIKKVGRGGIHRQIVASAKLGQPTFRII